MQREEIKGLHSMEIAIKKENKLRISILGDSISTFAGYTPKSGVFYDSYVQWETGVRSVEETWWMQVIRALHGELGTNNSIAGSMVSGNLSTSAMALERIQALGENGIPDIILVSAGCNDWGFCVLPEEFESSYQIMLHRLKSTYPHAQIWCCTLPEGKEPQGPTFFNMDDTISKRVYSDIIRKCVQKAEVHLADIGKQQKEYETVDGVHPNKEGMRTLAELWLDLIH